MYEDSLIDSPELPSNNIQQFTYQCPKHLSKFYWIIMLYFHFEIYIYIKLEIQPPPNNLEEWPLHQSLPPPQEHTTAEQDFAN